MLEFTLGEYTIKYWEVVHQWNASSRRSNIYKVYSVIQAIDVLDDITIHVRYRSILYQKACILLQDIIENADDGLTTTYKYEHRL